MDNVLICFSDEENIWNQLQTPSIRKKNASHAINAYDVSPFQRRQQPSLIATLTNDYY